MKRLLDVLAVALLVAGALLLLVGLRLRSDPAGRVNCRNNLRKLGLAAIQYTDDLRFFPHVAGTRQLDGGLETTDSARSLRALVWYGYLESYGDWICPASGDRARTGAVARAPEAARTQRPPPGAPLSPFRDAGADDTRLDQARDLSYGWTRRHHNSSGLSRNLLAADRATRAPGTQQGMLPEAPLQGNHVGLINVLHLDSTVVEVSAFDDPTMKELRGWEEPASYGPGTSYRGGWLPIQDPRAPRSAPLAPPPGATLVVAGVVAFLALAARRP